MRGYGNIKLNGKKFKLLRCGCCEVFNCIHEKNVEIMKREIRQFEYKRDLEAANSNDKLNVA